MDGEEPLSLPGHPVFIRPVNFAFLQDFEHDKFVMVNAHWNILQMHTHLQYDSIAKKTSPNGHSEINATSDGKEQLSLPGHPVFIRPVNFAFLQDFWACQTRDGTWQMDITSWFGIFKSFILHLDINYVIWPKKVTFDFDFWLPIKSYCKWTKDMPYAQV